MSQFPHVLEEINDLTRGQVETLLSQAKRIKDGYLTKTHSLSHFEDQTVITYFSENSTRTKISFIQSIYNLGLRHINFDVHLSSIQKGENLEETLQTLKHLDTDLVIYRTNKTRELHEFKDNPPFKIINAGDGINQHPTQALLDLSTMIDNGHDPAGKTISIIGDCVHSRVCHSLIDLLTMWGAEILLVGPKELVPEKTDYENVSICQNLDEAIEQSDLLYPLRIQFERHSSQEEQNFSVKYHDEFGITLDRLKKHNRSLPVYHAGPANIGVEIDTSIVQSDLYMAYHQVAHSIPMRTAIIRSILQGDRTGDARTW